MSRSQKVKVRFKYMDKTLLITTLLLIIFGTLNIVTASSREAVVNADANLFYYFYRHIIILFIGLIGFFFIIRISTKEYKYFIKPLYIVFLGLNLYLILKGVATRGANNWINLKVFKFQPSEFTKPLLIIYLAVLFEKYSKKLSMKNVKHDMIIWKILGYGLFPVALVFLQKDLGTATILLLIFMTLYVSSPISGTEKFKSIIIVSMIGIIALLTMLSFSGYILSKAQMSRFDFYNPCKKYETTGYQVCNAFIAINNGGLTGVGLGKSTQKYSYIPEPHTDMVFSIIAEENGFIICSIIFVIYIIILYRIIKLSLITKDLKNRYICLGIAMYIFAHIFINLGGLFGVIPLTGVPLPFFSYGGSFMLSLIASLAVLQRISIESKYQSIKIN